MEEKYKERKRKKEDRIVLRGRRRTGEGTDEGIEQELEKNCISNVHDRMDGVETYI